MRRRIASLVSLALLASMLPALTLPVAAEDPPPPGTVTVHYKQITGPPAERMNLVILGDGYQHDESWKFHRDVDRNLAVLWSVEPYRSYRNYMNIYLIEIVSADSGVRCDPNDQANPNNNFKVTPLRLWYNGSATTNGCVDPLARGTVYGPAPDPSAPCVQFMDLGCSGNNQHNRLLTTYMTPIGVSGQNVQTLAIFNTFAYGGIGGTQATTSGGSPQGPLISVHELGHSHGQMADEYPYSSRPTPGGPAPSTEPGSFHHSRMTHDQMVATQSKWWRWLCEKSESGGIITARDSTCGPPHEGGNTRSSNIWRPSEHSIMRWIGNHFDQVGREHMVGRISGRRNANAMVVLSTPQGEVGSSDVLWVETQHPRYHELDVTWRIGGAAGEIVPGTNNSRNLPLGPLALEAGTIVHVTVSDPTEFVRDPGLANGPRMTQTRQWTVGTPLTPTEVPVEIGFHSPNDRPVGGLEVVWVEPTHPTDRVLDVAWQLDGAPIPNPTNSRNLDLAALALPAGTYNLTATVTDPAAPGGASETVSWTVDNVPPTAPRTLSAPLTTLAYDGGHNVYFGEFDMLLEPQDDQPGYVVGELRLNDDGWFNYFGFPEEPFGTPFKFSHSGTDVKALTYGNLGSGGLSKVAWEQTLPEYGFEPGYGTHLVEHRALDAAGNYGQVESFHATVLPGGSPSCTSTVSNTRSGRLIVSSGVTCVTATAQLNGGVTVRAGASLVVADGASISGGLISTGAAVIHLFGASVNGDLTISGTSTDLIVAGSAINGSLVLTNNDGAITPISTGETRSYGVVVVGNTITKHLTCSGNDPDVTDFGAPNQVTGTKDGQCADL